MLLISSSQPSDKGTLDSDVRRWACAVFASGKLTPEEKLVCATVLFDYDGSRRIGPTTREIARRCGIPMGPTRVALARLEYKRVLLLDETTAMPNDELGWIAYIPDYNAYDEWFMEWT
jgi:hypothetical protein